MTKNPTVVSVCNWRDKIVVPSVRQFPQTVYKALVLNQSLNKTKTDRYLVCVDNRIKCTKCKNRLFKVAVDNSEGLKISSYMTRLRTAHNNTPDERDLAGTTCNTNNDRDDDSDDETGVANLSGEPPHKKPRIEEPGFWAVGADTESIDVDLTKDSNNCALFDRFEKQARVNGNKKPRGRRHNDKVINQFCMNVLWKSDHLCNIGIEKKWDLGRDLFLWPMAIKGN